VDVSNHQLVAPFNLLFTQARINPSVRRRISWSPFTMNTSIASEIILIYF
jgi:hypothetical protein